MKKNPVPGRFCGKIFFYFIGCLFLLTSRLPAATSCTAESPLDSLLFELDQTIEQQSRYEAVKDEYIYKLRQQLINPNLSDENKYFLCQQLFKEYETYRGDTAVLYAMQGLELAEKLRQESWVFESKLMLANALSKASLFDKALGTLHSIPSGRLSSLQQVAYYRAFFQTYVFLTECYPEGYDINHWAEGRKTYRDSLLTVLPAGTYEYALYYGTKYIESDAFEKAEEVLLSYYPQINPDTQEYALFTSIVAYLYERKGEPVMRQKYLALSAMADMKACVKENISLRFLAMLLFQSGDVERANFYIQKSMDDANFYNAHLRNIQIAKVFPIIVGAYQANRNRQEKQLTTLLVVESLLSIVLLLAVYWVVRQKRTLAKAQKEILEINARLNRLNEELSNANQYQKQTTRSLAEANYIKERFIGSFLLISTRYIDKFKNFKTFVGRKIKVGQTADILKWLEKTEGSTKELKELYAVFDQTFLSIYPDFVSELNKLLRVEERYPMDDSLSLNHELRVFALIRLGITDANKIASFLHYALRTVYNYKSKVRSKAMGEGEDFEDRVRRVCLPGEGDVTFGSSQK